MEIKLIKGPDYIVIICEDRRHQVPAQNEYELVTYLFRRFKLCPEEGYRLLDLFKEHEILKCFIEFKMNN